MASGRVPNIKAIFLMGNLRWTSSTFAILNPPIRPETAARLLTDSRQRYHQAHTAAIVRLGNRRPDHGSATAALCFTRAEVRFCSESVPILAAPSVSRPVYLAAQNGCPPALSHHRPIAHLTMSIILRVYRKYGNDPEAPSPHVTVAWRQLAAKLG